MICALVVAAVLAVGPTSAHVASDDPAVVFEQSGGIAGWVSRLTIRPNGSATVVDHSGARHHFVLTAAEERRVVRRLAAADLPEIAGRYTTPGAADLFVYRIASGRAQVIADQLALPQQAEPLVRTLTRLISAQRWTSTGG